MTAYLAGSLLLSIPAYFGIRLMIKENRKRKKQLEFKRAYKRMVKRANLSIEDSESGNKKVIALDGKNKKLLIIDHNKKNRQEQCIPLLDIVSCTIHEVRDGPGKNIKKINLELKTRAHEIFKFCFYDDAYDAITELPSLARRAMYWKSRIDGHKHPGNVNAGLEYVL
jgi:hypothetical protein